MSVTRVFSILLSVVLLFSVIANAQAQSVDRAQLDREIDALWEQIKVKQDLLLDTPAEDKAAYAEFLKQPDTGLIRLLARERYDEQHKLPLRGGGAFYSFVRKTHEYGYGSDISLSRGEFSVGFAGFDFGLLATLGDLPLEEVSFENAVIKALAEFQPPLAEADIRTLQYGLYTGVSVGGLSFTSRVKAKAATTYVVRSISYDRSDVLVAFRVVRQDEDGSLILLWKTLKTFTAPKSVRRAQNQ